MLRSVPQSSEIEKKNHPPTESVEIVEIRLALEGSYDNVSPVVLQSLQSVILKSLSHPLSSIEDDRHIAFPYSDTLSLMMICTLNC